MTQSVSPTDKASFQGLRVGAFESRMASEMERLIRNLGGTPFGAPAMREVALENKDEITAFGRRLLDGKIDVLILMTGVGTRALIKNLSILFDRTEILKALKSTTLVARGPKPLRALSEVELTPTILIPEPNTWREILRVLDEKLSLSGKTLVVQEYGESNKILLAELTARGATVESIKVYRAALPEDLGPLRSMIERISKKEIDVLLFTNATQVDHLMSIAREMGLAQKIRTNLEKIVVASVGPTCSEAVRRHLLPLDLEPERTMMGALVTAAADLSADILNRKKTISVDSPSDIHSGKKETGLLQSSLFLRACRREKTERTPIWLMRQAGRYMKEYRELRAKVSFLDLCKNSDLASEVTVDAAHRLGVDAAIIFSDLLMIVEPLGFDLSYGPDQGPSIGNPFRSAADLKQMKSVEPTESLGFTLDAIQKTRKALRSDLPLIGFAGAPFTMASYIIEGKGSKNFVQTKRLMHEDESAWNGLLERITTATIDYLNVQIQSGCQAVQIFDSWVGCLTPEDYRRFVFPHTKRLIAGIKPGTPVISFGTQTGGGLLPLIVEAGGDVIGVDWRIELDEAWSLIGPQKAIMGNLDPTTLISTKVEIERQAKRILTQASGRAGHIFNLGHGVLPETPLENVLHLIDVVKKESARS